MNRNVGTDVPTTLIKDKTMRKLINTLFVGSISVMASTGYAFESFENYQAGAEVDATSNITHMVTVDQCTDGEKSLSVNYSSGDQWNPLKVTLASSVDASSATHIAFDAINNSGVTAALLVKIFDGVGNDAWHWINIDQPGTHAYAIDLSYVDSNNSGTIDYSDVSVIDFGNATSSDGANVYIDNLRLSDDSPVVGAGCNLGGAPDPTEPETELRTEAGSLGGLVIIMLSSLLWMRRRISY
jgi:hypothetical protein